MYGVFQLELPLGVDLVLLELGLQRFEFLKEILLFVEVNQLDRLQFSFPALLDLFERSVHLFNLQRLLCVLCREILDLLGLFRCQNMKVLFLCLFN